ncbi:MAG: N5-glutamine methyltransferase family protein [Candidatus Krumholzibacteriia bacterium]
MPSHTWTTLDLLQTTARYLDDRGADSPRLAAERLLAHVLDCRRVDLYLDGERPVAEVELAPYRNLVREYAAGAPIQYIVGETEFMGLVFQADRRALIPRPETEILVDALVKQLRPRMPAPTSILELGTGSGAIAVALAVALPGAEVWSTEIDPGPAALALANARRHGVESRLHVLVMDRFEALSPGLAGAFDCIVSNPPYVRTRELAGLPDRVREYEPVAALHGGADGLTFHRHLGGAGLRFLGAGGTLGV